MMICILINIKQFEGVDNNLLDSAAHGHRGARSSGHGWGTTFSRALQNDICNCTIELLRSEEIRVLNG